MTKVGGTRARSSPKFNKENDQDQVGRGDELDKGTNISTKKIITTNGEKEKEGHHSSTKKMNVTNKLHDQEGCGAQ